MNATTMRASKRRSVGSVLALVAVAWIALIAPPCVMGLTLDGPAPAAGDFADHHDCPHCPPEGAIEVARDECTSVSPEGVAAPRADNTIESPAMAAAAAPGIPGPIPAARAARTYQPLPGPPRPGPRPHLRHGQFNE